MEDRMIGADEQDHDEIPEREQDHCTCAEIEYRCKRPVCAEKRILVFHVIPQLQLICDYDNHGRGPPPSNPEPWFVKRIPTCAQRLMRKQVQTTPQRVWVSDDRSWKDFHSIVFEYRQYGFSPKWRFLGSRQNPIDQPQNARTQKILGHTFGASLLTWPNHHFWLGNRYVHLVYKGSDFSPLAEISVTRFLPLWVFYHTSLPIERTTNLRIHL